MSDSTVVCPSCGAEYRFGTTQCADCRVALLPPGATPPEVGDDAPLLIEMGTWPRVNAVLIRRHLETAGVSVFLDLGPGTGTIFVSDEQADFADAVIRELDGGDTSTVGLEDAVDALEDNLASAGALLEELRARLDAERRS
ncbi:MAG: hypothetical protein R3A49_05110 [Acidimicrobiia bacterium]